MIFSILLAVVWFLVGWKAREFQALRTMNKIIKAEEAKMQAQTSEAIDNSKKMRVTIEKHKNVMYVYEEGTGTFMAQGATEEELGDRLRERYPNTLFVASSAELEQVGLE